MATEIGSEFWDVPESGRNTLFPENTNWFLSGRSALKAILAQSHIRKAALPSWCCDSMIKPFLDVGAEVCFYPVYMENGLVQDLSGVDADGILVMDYFGYTGHANLGSFGGTVIRDVTHSLLSKAYQDANYYFGSLRKWAGFWTGGYSWGGRCRTLPQDTLYTGLRQKAMAEKAYYMQGHTQSKAYLDVFSQAEEYLESCPIAGAAPRDVEKARRMDVSLIKMRRRQNAARLMEAVSDLAIFPHIGENDCPMFVPIMVPDGQRDALRRYLIEQEIYCPVHWPLTHYHDANMDARSMEIYRNELSLVCDQRYTLEDMDRIIATIKDFWKR